MRVHIEHLINKTNKKNLKIYHFGNLGGATSLPATPN